MAFVTGSPEIKPERPLFCSILANTLLSVVPGISGAGATPEKTLLTPILDAELIACGTITSMPVQAGYADRLPNPGIDHQSSNGAYRALTAFYQRRACPYPHCPLS